MEMVVSCKTLCTTHTVANGGRKGGSDLSYVLHRLLIVARVRWSVLRIVRYNVFMLRNTSTIETVLLICQYKTGFRN